MSSRKRYYGACSNMCMKRTLDPSPPHYTAIRCFLPKYCRGRVKVQTACLAMQLMDVELQKVFLAVVVDETMLDHHDIAARPGTSCAAVERPGCVPCDPATQARLLLQLLSVVLLHEPWDRLLKVPLQYGPCSIPVQDSLLELRRVPVGGVGTGA